jgi:uncharacterized protein (TIGR03437 family)
VNLRVFVMAMLIVLVGCIRSAVGQSSGPPTIVQFVATPTSVTPGQAAVLTYQVLNATAVSISGVGANLPPVGSVTVNPTTTTTYILSASNAAGTVTASAIITVAAANIPQILQFDASPATIGAGQTTTLEWVAVNATTVTLTSVGSVLAQGSVSVSPTVTTTYTLQASNAAGNVKGNVTVTVTPAVYADRKMVDFGAIPIGRKAELMVNVVAPAEAAVGTVHANFAGSTDFSFSVPSSSGTASGASVQFDIASGTVVPVLVAFTPSQAAVQQSSISLTLPGGVTSTVALSGSGTAATDTNISAVLNAANSLPSIAPGTWVAIYGEQMSSTTRMWGADDFVNGALPTSLDGVGVTFNGVPGYIYYISSGQVNALIPLGLAAGQARQGDADGCWNLAVQVKNSASASNPVVVSACAVAPSLFRNLVGNQYYAAAVLSDGTVLDPSGNSRAAEPGEIISVYATGLGQGTPAPANLDLPIAPYPTIDPPFGLWIDGQAATVVYEGQVGPGEYQINVTIPQTARDGNLALEITPTQGPVGASGSLRIIDALYIPVHH